MNGEELRGPGEIPENRLQVAGPHGADVTQGLGDHEVWRERLQAGQIEGESGAVGGRQLADRLIEPLAGEGGVEQGKGDARAPRRLPRAPPPPAAPPAPPGGGGTGQVGRSVGWGLWCGADREIQVPARQRLGESHLDHPSEPGRIPIRSLRSRL